MRERERERKTQRGDRGDRGERERARDAERRLPSKTTGATEAATETTGSLVFDRRRRA